MRPPEPRSGGTWAGLLDGAGAGELMRTRDQVEDSGAPANPRNTGARRPPPGMACVKQGIGQPPAHAPMNQAAIAEPAAVPRPEQVEAGHEPLIEHRDLAIEHEHPSGQLDERRGKLREARRMVVAPAADEANPRPALVGHDAPAVERAIDSLHRRSEGARRYTLLAQLTSNGARRKG